MDVPDALCIMFACPVVTIILSALMLRDKLNIVKICAGGLLLSGVLLVCRPPFLFDTLTSLLGLDPTQEDDMYAIGVVLAITACVSGGLMDVLVAKCENVSASVLLLWTAMFGLVIAVIYGVLHPGSNILSRNCLNIPPQDWGIFFGKSTERNVNLKKYPIVGLAISGMLAFTTLTRSLQLISPNLVASLRTLELVLAFTVQSLLSGVPPGILSCLGGTFILLGESVQISHFKQINCFFYEFNRRCPHVGRTGSDSKSQELLPLFPQGAAVYFDHADIGN